MAKNEIANLPSEEDAFGYLAEFKDDIAKDAGSGNENIASNDLSIPYIGILQKMSPQCDSDAAEYMPNAKPGMLFQNLNKFLWDGDEGLEVVPVSYERKVIEWVPREKGGGLVAVHDANTPLLNECHPNEKNIPVNKAGNLMIDTATHYVLYKSPLSDRFEPAVISMKSTNHKKSRLWNSLIAQQTIPGTEQQAPRWLFRWIFKTVLEVKDQNRWYNYEIVRGDPVNMETYKTAKKLHQQFLAGGLAAKEPTADSEIPF